MTFGRNSYLASVLSVLCVVAAGCSSQPSSGPTPQAPPTNTPNAAPPPSPTVASQIDARWMGFDTSQPWSWEEPERRMTSDFQQFGFRPVGETELPRRCNGCGTTPPTAYVTVYASGKFDPSEARTGEPVGVNNRAGFFRPSDGTNDAVLAWAYSDTGWATVRGTTTATSELDRMLELAKAFRPNQRTPVRVPLSLANLPAHMPLAEISAGGPDGTYLSFAACGMADNGGATDCAVNSESLRVQVFPTDANTGHLDEQAAMPVKVGGKDGKWDETDNQAAVRIDPGQLVEFELDGAGSAAPTVKLADVLANVTWAPDPGNETTWRPVTDWVK
jgi:hypothetical protein